VYLNINHFDILGCCEFELRLGLSLKVSDVAMVVSYPKFLGFLCNAMEGIGAIILKSMVPLNNLPILVNNL
jgi:hypothetical protein